MAVVVGAVVAAVVEVQRVQALLFLVGNVDDKAERETKLTMSRDGQRDRFSPGVVHLVPLCILGLVELDLGSLAAVLVFMADGGFLGAGGVFGNVFQVLEDTP